MKFDFKSNKSVSYEGSHSWRELNQTKSKKIITFASILRRVRGYLKYIFLLLVLLGLFGFIKFVFLPSTETGVGSELSENAFLTKVLFQTDGVLDESWLAEATQLNRKVKLIDIDIYDIKSKLEAYDQVVRAEVIRVFPDSLKIGLVEEQPICKLIVEPNNNNEHAKQWLLSENGIIFSAHGYTEDFYEDLPAFFPYNQEFKTSESILGMDRILPLIKLYLEARFDEDLKIKAIESKNFSGEIGMPGQVIEIQTERVPRILFSAYEDFSEQMKRLRYILIHLGARGNPEVLKVDLSLMRSAAVQFKEGRFDAF